MFEAVDLARLQFALTSIYHWLFVAVHTRHDSDCSYLRVDICVYR